MPPEVAGSSPLASACPQGWPKGPRTASPADRSLRVHVCVCVTCCVVCLNACIRACVCVHACMHAWTSMHARMDKHASVSCKCSFAPCQAPAACRCSCRSRLVPYTTHTCTCAPYGRTRRDVHFANLVQRVIELLVTVGVAHLPAESPPKPTMQLKTAYQSRSPSCRGSGGGGSGSHELVPGNPGRLACQSAHLSRCLRSCRRACVHVGMHACVHACHSSVGACVCTHTDMLRNWCS